MRDLTNEIVELIRRGSVDLPADVEARLREALGRETPGSAAYRALETILANVELARRNSTPICQDTGTPIFQVKYPSAWSTRPLRQQIRAAVAEATKRAYLRPNAVESLSGQNKGDNLGGDEFPVIHFDEIEGEELTIELMLKGGGCENVGAQYALPDERLGAGRDLEGVRRAVLDAVYRAQGQGCAPGILGVAIGGDRETAYRASKQILFEGIDQANPDSQLEALEQRLTDEANQLGIGPMGFGGRTTILDTKIIALHRLPASYFVTISYLCWAYRRRKMTVRGGEVFYD